MQRFTPEQIRANRQNLRVQLKNTCFTRKESQPLDRHLSEKTADTSSSDFEELLSQKCRAEETFDECYETKEKLGEGAQSVVKRVVDRNTGQQYAAKIMRNQDAETILKIKQQFKLLKTLQLPTIVQAHSLFISERERTCRLLLDLCDWEDLRSQLNQFGHFSEEFVADVMKALLETCDYLHSKGICHRDIKPENVLYSPNDTPCLKIVDFGISTYMKGQGQEMWSTTGTLFYKAPEMFIGGYTNKVDVWAVGIIGYELLHGHMPFAREFVDDTIHEIMTTSPDITEDIDGFAQDFLRKCLAKDPKERPSAKEALKHPFMLRTISRPVTPKINLNNSFEDDKQFLEETSSPYTRQSPAMCLRSMDHARKYSGSNLLDLEMGVKYEKTNRGWNQDFTGFTS